MKSTTMRDSRTERIKTEVFFRGQKRQCYNSHVNCQITASKNNMYLGLVYGLGNTPMMLATNCEIKSKDDVVKVLRNYMSRWRIEEYFRCKKVEFGFEDFRVRNLKAINTLNKLLSFALGFLAMLAEKSKTSELSHMLIMRGNAYKDRMLFYVYQLSKGVREVLNFTKEGIKSWQRIRKNEHIDQLCFRLSC